MAITLNGVNLEQPGKWWSFHLEAWPTTFGGWCLPEYRAELIAAVSGYSHLAPPALGNFFAASNASGTADSLVGPNPAQKAGFAGHLIHDHHAFVRGAVTPNNAINYVLVDGFTSYPARACSMRWGWAADGENRFAISFSEIGVPVTTATLLSATTGDVSGADLEIGAGLTNSALIGIVGRHANQDPTAVTWTVGGNNTPATFVSEVDGSDVGMSLYYVLNPTPGIGNFHADGGSLGGFWVGIWLLDHVDQSSPLAAYTFGTGTGTTTAITGSAPFGAFVLDGFYVGHGDFVNDGHPALPTPSAGQTLDSRGTLQLGPPGYSDWLIGISHGDSTPTWTQDQSRPWAGVVIAVRGG